ncbi:MAG TPA: serine/threonine-protein kinase [Chitinophagaceae bacterium]
MAKVFTITGGLENMGALKTGGQGSVYKARRSDGVLSAVKLMPTPILSENEDDKHYADFKNEVEKLKKVNEEHNPYIVKILSAGVTDTGAFPYIEMEFIEGPDLGELLQPPHPPIFTLKEVQRVAEHLSNALGHCHSLGVKHGDIKSNNVKLDTRAGNYVLLDFGLAVMSDEQRRTSLRHAGAIEFMAPEQNEGQMLFQTDVYSFGVVLFELLAGQVPFPLNSGGETARNAVMVAHMEEPIPDLIALRRQHLPADWSEEQKLQEMLVPRWLLQTVERCLQKRPGDRFLSAIELHDHIAQHLAATAVAPAVDSDEHLHLLHRQNEELARRNEELRQQLSRTREEPIAATPIAVAVPPSEEPLVERTTMYTEPPRRHSGMSAGALALLALLVVGGGMAGYTLLKDDRQESYIASGGVSSTDTTNDSRSDDPDYYSSTTPEEEPLADVTVPDTFTYQEPEPVVDTATLTPAPLPEEPVTAPGDETDPPKQEQTKKEEPKEEEPASSGIGSYKVVNKAYFHNEPDESTRREAFIIHWNNAVLKPTREENGFVYVVFTNHLGQTSKGWLKKSDLEEVKE